MHHRTNTVRAFLRTASAAFLFSALGNTAPAQVWQVTNAGVHLEGEGYADDFLTPAIPMHNEMRNFLIPGFRNLSYGTRYGFDLFDEHHNPDSAVGINSKALATVAGDGTRLIDIVWHINCIARATALDGFRAEVNSQIQNPIGPGNFFVELNTIGLPPGTPIAVHYSWDVRSRAFNDRELVTNWPADYARIRGSALSIGGTEVLTGRFDADVIPPFVDMEYRLDNQTGSIYTFAGSIIRIDVTGLVEAGIGMDGEDANIAGKDSASAIFKGRLRLTCGITPNDTPPEPLPVEPGMEDPYSILDFSVDIAGDAELSAAPADGDEVFDPGDVYEWSRLPDPLIPPPGANGWRDDATAMMGSDPSPAPGVFGLPPVCSGVPIGSVSRNHFDLDGHDGLAFSLRDLFLSGAPPFDYFEDPLLNSPEHLLISYEDDQSRPYTQCEVPIMGPSPLGKTHGSSADGDEVVGLLLSMLPPLAVAYEYPFADENMVHQNMQPDPTATSQEVDDDVDSLDAPDDVDEADYWVFGVDHEATYVNPVGGVPLQAGAIYQAMPGGPPVKVIDPFVHLGLPSIVDIADFEFVWMENTALANEPVQLAMIFAVHENDPTTPPNESVGLDTRQLYVSFLDGTSFPLFVVPLDDAIDAVTSIRHQAFPYVPPPCPGDWDGNGFVTFADITHVLGGFNNPYTFQHITITLTNWGRICP